MKFLKIISAIIAFFYGVMAIHFLSFDSKTKAKELNLISKSQKEVKISDTFLNDSYKGFVYE